MKKALLDVVDVGGLDRRRVGRDELDEIKNKGVRRFYEEQNERLNDWVEVDTLVMVVVDDVIDSMNPDPGMCGLSFLDFVGGFIGGLRVWGLIDVGG